MASVTRNKDGTVTVRTGCLIPKCKHRFEVTARPEPGKTVDLRKMNRALFKQLRLHYAEAHS